MGRRGEKYKSFFGSITSKRSTVDITNYYIHGIYVISHQRDELESDQTSTYQTQ